MPDRFLEKVKSQHQRYFKSCSTHQVKLFSGYRIVAGTLKLPVYSFSFWGYFCRLLTVEARLEANSFSSSPINAIDGGQE
jgi:hypothetical protein